MGKQSSSASRRGGARSLPRRISARNFHGEFISAVEMAAFGGGGGGATTYAHTPGETLFRCDFRPMPSRVLGGRPSSGNVA